MTLLVVHLGISQPDTTSFVTTNHRLVVLSTEFARVPYGKWRLHMASVMSHDFINRTDCHLLMKYFDVFHRPEFCFCSFQKCLLRFLFHWHDSSVIFFNRADAAVCSHVWGSRCTLRQLPHSRPFWKYWLKCLPLVTVFFVLFCFAFLNLYHAPYSSGFFHPFCFWLWLPKDFAATSLWSSP